MKSLNFPGADPINSSVKSVLSAQNGFKDFLRDGFQTDTALDERLSS